MNTKKLGVATAMVAGLAISGAADANFATVSPSQSGYEVTYNAFLPYTLNGNSLITDVIAFVVDSNGNVEADILNPMAVGGNVSLTQSVDLLPEYAFVIGRDALIPSDSTTRDHLVMFVDHDFAQQAVMGGNFRQAFSLDPNGTYGEGRLILDLIAAALGDQTAMDYLISYVKDMGITVDETPALGPARFALGGSFTVLESSVPGIIPEPATVALFGLGLASLGAVRRRKLAA